MSEKELWISRFSVIQRMEHWLLVVSFTLLALTGLPQKYPTVEISDFFIGIMGGIEVVRVIHRIAATVFILESVYHLVVVGYKLFVLRVKATLLPGFKDVTDGVQSLLYNVGIRKEQPKMGRYNFAEKLEYWAMAWGLILMGLTGLMLWNPIATTTALPGEFIPAAKVAHGNEAVLAVLAIIIWHFYSVHLKHWNWSMLRGKLSRVEMEEEHALELEEIEAGVVTPKPAPAVQKKRTTIYAPIAAAITILVLVALFRFITFEESALATVPPLEGNVPVYQKQTSTPLPTRAPTATSAPQPTAAAQATQTPGGTTALTWDSGIGVLFADNCKACHGALGGLSLTSYADTMKGGATGVIIKAGNPDGSSLIAKMTGTHPKVFTPEELTKIKDWIKAGALEK